MISFLNIKDRLFYGWVIVIAALIIGTLTFGTRNAFGVFFKSLEGEFGLSRAMTSGILSIHLIVGTVFIIIGGWALDKYGPRILTFLMGLFTGFSLILTSQASSPWQIYMSYSLLLSLGAGPAYAVLMATVSRWFNKKRGLAMGIASIGGPFGQIALAPLATYFILNFGWRTAFLVVGVIAGLTVMSLSLLLRKDPGNIGTLPDGDRAKSGETTMLEDGQKISRPPDNFSIRQLISMRVYWFLWLTGLFQGFCLFLVFTHIVPYVIDMGMSAMSAAAVLSLMAGISILGRLIAGFISDRIGSGITSIFCASVMAVALLWLIWSHNIWMFYLFALVYGFAYGGLNPVILTLIADIFGTTNIGVIMGTLSVGFALGSAIGPFIGGFVFDINSSYSAAFALGAILMLLGAFFLVFVKRIMNPSPSQLA